MIVIGNIADMYVLVVLNEDSMSYSVKELAIKANFGTVKMYHKLQEFNGKRFGDTVIYNNENDAKKALEWLEQTIIMNTLVNVKRPSYGR